MADERLGRVYKIESKDGGQCYVGSTHLDLTERMSVHKSSHKAWVKAGRQGNKCSSFDLFDEYGVEDCRIVCLQTVKFLLRDELNCLEQYWIIRLHAINTNASYLLPLDLKVKTNAESIVSSFIRSLPSVIAKTTISDADLERSCEQKCLDQGEGMVSKKFMDTMAAKVMGEPKTRMVGMKTERYYTLPSHESRSRHTADELSSSDVEDVVPERTRNFFNADAGVPSWSDHFYAPKSCTTGNLLRIPLSDGSRMVAGVFVKEYDDGSCSWFLRSHGEGLGEHHLPIVKTQRQNFRTGFQKQMMTNKIVSMLSADFDDLPYLLYITERIDFDANDARERSGAFTTSTAVWNDFNKWQTKNYETLRKVSKTWMIRGMIKYLGRLEQMPTGHPVENDEDLSNMEDGPRDSRKGWWGTAIRGLQNPKP